MASNMNRVIILRGESECIRYEAACGETALTPGMLVEFNSSGELDPCAKDATAAEVGQERAFVLENHLVGGDIDKDYADGDLVQYCIAARGSKINAIVAKSAASIVVGAFVQSGGDGTVEVYADGTAIGMAMEAVDNSGNSGSTARIAIRIL